MSLLHDIRTIIEAESDLVFADDLFVAREPAEPSNVVTILAAPGGPPAFDNEGKTYHYPAIQVRVRNASWSNADNLSWQLLEILHAKSGLVFDGWHYSLIAALDDPHTLEFDSNNRAKVVTNYQIQRSRVEEAVNGS